MHFPIKMICQSSIVIESAQICPTNIADLQFLMSTGTRGVRQGLELALFFLFGGSGDTDLVMFGHGKGDGARFA